MSITTQAGAIAGLMLPVPFVKTPSVATVTGAPQSFFEVAGNPAAGTPNTGLTGANYSSSSVVPAGILYHQDPPSGDAYLARFVASCITSLSGTVMLLDRLWDCGPTIDVSTAQTITQPTLPARDAAGTTAGLGVLLAVEVVAAASATAATCSVSYTDPANGSGRTGAFIDQPTAAAAGIGRFYRIGLQAGDIGVASVQSVTFATPWTTGTIALVAYRVLAMLELQTQGLPNQLDVVSAALPQLYNGTCPFLVLLPSGATGSYLSGVYQETQG